MALSSSYLVFENLNINSHIGIIRNYKDDNNISRFKCKTEIYPDHIILTSGRDDNGHYIGLEIFEDYFTYSKVSNKKVYWQNLVDILGI